MAKLRIYEQEKHQNPNPRMGDLVFFSYPILHPAPYSVQISSTSRQNPPIDAREPRETTRKPRNCPPTRNQQPKTPNQTQKKRKKNNPLALVSALTTLHSPPLSHLKPQPQPQPQPQKNPPRHETPG